MIFFLFFFCGGGKEVEEVVVMIMGIGWRDGCDSVEFDYIPLRIYLCFENVIYCEF